MKLTSKNTPPIRKSHKEVKNQYNRYVEYVRRPHDKQTFQREGKKTELTKLVAAQKAPLTININGFCCYNKINYDLFLNNSNARHSGFACLFLFVGHRVPEEGVRSWLKRINPDGVALPWLQISPRRSYSVPGPLSPWHINGNHKLIRYMHFHSTILTVVSRPDDSNLTSKHSD